MLVDVDLKAFVQRQVREKYGTAQLLCMRIGMTLSAFSRSVTAGSLSTENLLRLALETGTPSSDLLKIAKKEHVANLIEQLYGKAASAPASGEIRALAEMWPTLPPNVQEAVLVVVRELAKKHAQAKRRSA